MNNTFEVVPPADVGKTLPALVDEASPALIIDVETTGVEPYLGDRMFGLGVRPFGSGHSFYYIVETGQGKALDPVIDILRWRPLMGQNVKFDLHNIAMLGWEPTQEAFFDLLPLSRIWAKEERPALDLESLGERILGFKYSDEEALKAASRGQLHKLPVERQAGYNADDLVITEKLYSWLKGQLEERQLRLYAKEAALSRDLYDIERRGQLIDQDYLGWLAERLELLLDQLLAPIRQETGEEQFNPKSPQQVVRLMERLGVRPVSWTPKGAPSWDRDALVQVAGQHPIALQLAKYNALRYIESNMVARCIKTLNAGFRALHGTLQNWGTFTGRLSSAHPNRQNDPHGWLQVGNDDPSSQDILTWATGEKAAERDLSIERLFMARPGYGLANADYRQIEMYGLGYYMNDPVFDAWLATGNVHRAAAAEIWGDGDAYYDTGKVYNFATVYGQGDEARANLLGLPRKHVEETGHRMSGMQCGAPECGYNAIMHSAQYREEYAARMPGYQRFLNRVRRLLRRDGVISNLYSRDYWLDESLAYRGVNYLVQGSSGDYVKFKQADIRALRRALGVYTLKPTHDDFTFEFPLDVADRMPELFAALRPSPFGRDLEVDVEWSTRTMVDMEPWPEEVYAKVTA